MSSELADSVRQALFRDGPALIAHDARSGASTTISCSQLREWINGAVSALPPSSSGASRVVGLALPPFSVEESAWVVAITSQSQWVFVPLDVRLPLERLNEISKNAGVDLLVTWTHCGVHLEELDGVVSLPPLPGSTLQMSCFYRHTPKPASWLEPLAYSDAQPLYVLSTSGSTGRPKGVAGTRKGTIERIDWMVKTLPMDSASDAVIRTTRLPFIDAVPEILGAVLSCVTLVHLRFTGVNDEPALVDSVILQSPLTFAVVIAKYRVTRFTSIPSVLRVFLRGFTGLGNDAVHNKLSSILIVMTSGELLTLSTLQELFAMLPQAKVVNLYGSTEVSGDITWKEVRPPLSDAQIRRWGQLGVPISDFPIRSIGETTQILTSNLKDIEESSSGGQPIELLVSGGALAAGYVDDGVLSRPSNKYSVDGSGREWFNMGDTCLIMDDEVWFCGRQDRQVKIRGNRVQLEAIELALKSVIADDDNLMEKFPEPEITAIFETTTTAEETQEGGFIAFISCQEPQSGNRTRCTQCNIDGVEHGALRRIVKSLTRNFGPLYVPRDFFVINERYIPRLSSGKTDLSELKKSLQLHRNHARGVDTDTNAYSKDEAKFTEVVARSLGFPNNSIPTESLDSTWLEIGGNSLQATLVSWEIERLCAITLPHHQILEMTIRDLIKAIRRPKRKRDEPRKVRHTSKDKADSKAEIIVVQEKRRSNSSVGVWYSRANSSSHPKKMYPTIRLGDDAIVRLSVVGDVDLGKCIDASPLIVRKRASNDTLWALIGSHSGRFMSVEVNSRTEQIHTRWSTLLDDRIEGTASTSTVTALVFVGTYSGRLYALDLDTGTPRWSYQTSGIVKSSPLVVEELGIVVVGSYDHNLYGLDLRTGLLLWSEELPGSIFASPAFISSKQQIVVATTRGTLCAWRITRNTIFELWQVNFPAPIFASPVVVETRGGIKLLISCTDCLVYAVMAANGEIAWTLATGKPIFCTPCVYSTSDDASGRYALIGSHDGRLRKVSTETGKLEWDTDVSSKGDPIFASPCVATLSAQQDHELCKKVDFTIVCAATTSGRFEVLDEHSGSIRLSEAEGFDRRPVGEIFSSPVVVDGLCFVGTRENRLLIIRLSLDTTLVT